MLQQKVDICFIFSSPSLTRLWSLYFFLCFLSVQGCMPYQQILCLVFRGGVVYRGQNQFQITQALNNGQPRPQGEKMINDDSIHDRSWSVRTHRWSCVCVNGPAVKRLSVCCCVLIIERFHTFSRTECKSPVITTYSPALYVLHTHPLYNPAHRSNYLPALQLHEWQFCRICGKTVLLRRFEWPMYSPSSRNWSLITRDKTQCKHF